jgi:hypothetical protein
VVSRRPPALFGRTATCESSLPVFVRVLFDVIYSQKRY